MYKGLTDIGINLDSKQFGNRHQQILQSAKEHGVDTVITISNSSKEWAHNLEFCKKFGHVAIEEKEEEVPGPLAPSTFTMDSPFSYAAVAAKGAGIARASTSPTVAIVATKKKQEPKESAVYTTIGVHPHNASQCSNQLIAKMRDTIEDDDNKDHIVAIGECGLDYNRMFSPKDVQQKWFEEQIQLALTVGLPLYCHERESFHDFVTIVSKYNLRDRLIIHCFTGTKEELTTYLAMGFYIGITGFICDDVRGAGLQKCVNIIPLDRLMIETDSPFMAPRQANGPRIKCNEPKNVSLVAEKVAELYGLPVALIIERTTANAGHFFGF